ncbi:hypothetical protein ACPPVT_07450 [Angustibacter sp. McL0619]|uniref:hypothetical protein n=1 Tax=Angustibacter sp. McL0619 TaxID=3415676 RepID=UPI003CEA6871
MSNTFSTKDDRALYIEVPDPDNAGQVKRPDPGDVTVQVRDAFTLEDLGAWTSNLYGYLSYVDDTDTHPVIEILPEGESLWQTLYSKEEKARMQAAATLAAEAKALADATAQALTNHIATASESVDADAVEGIIATTLQSGQGVNVTVDPVTKKVSFSSTVPAPPTSLRELDDFNVPDTGTPAGTALTVDPTGAVVPGGRTVHVVDVGIDVSSLGLPAGDVVLFRPAAAPLKRHTLGQGAAAANVTAVLEGYSADVSNKAVYVTDRPSGLTGPTTSAEFAAGSIRYLADTGLTDPVTFGRFFFKIISVTGNANFWEARSTSTTSPSLGLLQLQAGGQIQVKNVATTVKTTSTAFSVGTWYRADYFIGGSSQRWNFYVGNSGTLLESTGTLGAGSSGIPDTIRLGYPLGANANAVMRFSCHDLSDSTLAAPWS